MLMRMIKYAFYFFKQHRHRVVSEMLECYKCLFSGTGACFDLTPAEMGK